MITEQRERNWDPRNPNGYRLKPLKQCLLMASVAEAIPGWFTITTFVGRYQDCVGELHRVTARRYLISMEEAGLLESKPGHRYEFRWAGWPPPIQ